MGSTCAWFGGVIGGSQAQAARRINREVEIIAVGDGTQIRLGPT